MRSIRTALTVTALVTGSLVGLMPGRASACSCLPSNLISTYWSAFNTDVFTGVVRTKRVAPGIIAYKIGITNTYKGCTTPGDSVLVTTSDSGASCGVDLTVGEEYLLTAHADGNGGYSINLCGFNVLASSLTKAQITFLNDRYVCCGKDCHCATGGLVQCFAQPCAVDQCGSYGAMCTDNYCNGCHAEWFNSDAPVCYPCAYDSDCAFGQSCVAGECI